MFLDFAFDWFGFGLIKGIKAGKAQSVGPADGQEPIGQQFVDDDA